MTILLELYESMRNVRVLTIKLLVIILLHPHQFRHSTMSLIKPGHPKEIHSVR